MKRAALLVAVALAGLLLGHFYSRPSPTTATMPVSASETHVPAATPSPSLETQQISAAVLQSPVMRAQDPEQLLRELEPLSVTDKPLALSRALAADAQMSPSGVMAEARRALIVTLMVDTERMPEARERAREFIRRYPESRYRPLVQGTTGIHPRPTPSQLRDAR